MAAGAAIFAPGGAGAGQQAGPAAPAPAALAPAALGMPGPGDLQGDGRLAVAANAIGISEAGLRAALKDGKTIAQVAKAHNVDVAKVIDALVADAQAGLRDRITAMVNGQRPEGRPGLRGRLGEDLALVAKTIGVSVADLRTALKGGKSIADVAKAHGVAVQKVIDALVTVEQAEHPNVPHDRLVARITRMVDAHPHRR